MRNGKGVGLAGKEEGEREAQRATKRRREGYSGQKKQMYKRRRTPVHSGAQGPSLVGLCGAQPQHEDAAAACLVFSPNVLPLEASRLGVSRICTAGQHPQHYREGWSRTAVPSGSRTDTTQS